ncbi:MAG TPA: VWA domain-containing protein [Acidimicrobiales bacterium]|jgi:Mg-chelatase subunit ChlD|nr:VWA domain-containing protein [Acidimicrobiales bacterium]
MADDERLRRWRLVLGSDAEDLGVGLDGDDSRRDGALGMLYGQGRGPGSSVSGRDNRGQPVRRVAGLGGSAPAVARWLGDIRAYFPTSVVRVMQRDAMDRMGLRQLLLEPELLEAVEPDVALVATLVALNQVIPAHSRETARSVIRHVTDELEQRLAQRTRSAITGALNRGVRTRRPRAGDIDWNRTIRANLRHYQPDYRTIVPERLVGFGRRSPQVQRDVVLCVDQSGSMAASVVYASVFSAVLASVRALRTQVVVFDTNVVDLTESITDPVELLFAVQLGGGTDINRAVTYCQGLITRPADTIFVLISDLIEGGLRDDLIRRMGAMVQQGVVAVALLALNDDGSPAYDHDVAAALAGVGVASFACTPDQFPDLMAAAIERRDVGQWAAAEGITTAAPLR